VEISHGQKAKVVGFEIEGSHEFNVGDVITFICVSEDDDKWYTFADKTGKIQDLVPIEFKLL
jgi:hypothetical protein